MAYTQEQIDALKAAIARGVRSEKLGDLEITYASVDEMLRLLAKMEAEVAAGASSASARIVPRHKLASFADDP